MWVFRYEYQGESHPHYARRCKRLQDVMQYVRARVDRIGYSNPTLTDPQGNPVDLKANP